MNLQIEVCELDMSDLTTIKKTEEQLIFNSSMGYFESSSSC